MELLQPNAKQGLASDGSDTDDWFGDPPAKPRFVPFGHDAAELRWEDVSMTAWQVAARAREPVHILKRVSGTAKPGCLTCILGPSGSGKSTLLNVLAGRQSGSRSKRQGVQIEGRVWAGGRRVDPRDFKSRIAYVMQKDEMCATATPREALQFSAALRLPAGSSSPAAFITELLECLGLQGCAGTCIGNAVINGISGGQRKRVAIGIELVTRPDVICLDEPTSGLDAFSAYKVVRVLKDLAKAGCTVLCTLHQPSSEVFAMVDHVLCLWNGACFYEGGRVRMAEHLSNIGYPCPAGFNPADFVIFLLQTEPPDRLYNAAAPSFSSHSPDPKLRSSRPSELSTSRFLDRFRRKSSDPFLQPSAQKSFGTQFTQLVRRELRAVFRDRTTLGVRFCLSVMLAFLFGLVFRGVGQTIVEDRRQPPSRFDLLWSGLTEDEVRALRKQKLEWHFNALVQVALVAMFSACQPTILAFPLERAVFLREYGSGAYGILPYYASKVAVELPMVFVQSLLTLSLCYFLMELNGNFVHLLLTMVLLSVCSVSVALAIGCMVRAPRETGAVGPLVFVPQMLFSGVFIPVRHIPASLRWMQYFCFLQYALKILGAVEFADVPHCEVLMRSQDIDQDSVWRYVQVLLLSMILFSCAGLVLLRQKASQPF